MTHRPRVTAGLTWQPAMEPMAYAATSSERPKASATPMIPTDPLGKKLPVARMAVPAPPTTRIIVPMDSAIPILRRLSTAFPFDRQFSIGSCGQIAPARVAGLLLAENTRQPGGDRRGPCAATVANPADDGPPVAQARRRYRPSSRALPNGRSRAPAVRWPGASIPHTSLHRVARDAARPVIHLRLAHPVAAGPCPGRQYAELGVHLPVAVLRLLCDLHVVAADPRPADRAPATECPDRRHRRGTPRRPQAARLGAHRGSPQEHGHRRGLARRRRGPRARSADPLSGDGLRRGDRAAPLDGRGDLPAARGRREGGRRGGCPCTRVPVPGVPGDGGRPGPASPLAPGPDPLGGGGRLRALPGLHLLIDPVLHDEGQE